MILKHGARDEAASGEPDALCRPSSSLLATGVLAEHFLGQGLGRAKSSLVPAALWHRVLGFMLHVGSPRRSFSELWARRTVRCLFLHGGMAVFTKMVAVLKRQPARGQAPACWIRARNAHLPMPLVWRTRRSWGCGGASGCQNTVWRALPGGSRVVKRATSQ